MLGAGPSGGPDPSTYTIPEFFPPTLVCSNPIFVTTLAQLPKLRAPYEDLSQFLPKVCRPRTLCTLGVSVAGICF